MILVDTVKSEGVAGELQAAANQFNEGRRGPAGGKRAGGCAACAVQ